MNSKFAAVALVIVLTQAGVSGAWADATYLTSSYETLYRVNPERGIESWDMGLKMRAMHQSLSTGTIYVMADAGGGADEKLYTLANGMSGTPTLDYCARLSNHYGGVVGIGEMLYAFSYGDMYSIDVSDPFNPIETHIGTTGLGSGSAGAAYDPDTGTLYLLSYATDSVYTVDPATAEATLLGALGIEIGEVGAAWFGGQLYAATQNFTANSFEIGTIDVASGAYSTYYHVADGASEVATALTIIPEPTTLLLLLGAGLVAVRRR